MPQSSPDFTTIRTALRMTMRLGGLESNGNLAHFYECQNKALRALDRLEKNGGNGKVSVSAPLTPLTEADVLAMECPTKG